MKKTIILSLLLTTLSACVSTTTKDSESLRLMDGSKVIIDNGKLVDIIDKTGEISSKNSGMMELANGDFIYIKRDGTVNKLESSSSSHGHNSKSNNNSSGGGHSH